MSIDAIGDFLTIIRNGLKVSKPSVHAPYSKIKESIAKILQEEGFIHSYETVVKDAAKPALKELKITLKYVGNESVIHEIKRVSRLGCRAYAGRKSIKPVIGGLGLSILTTNKGLLTHKQAKREKVGGEIICTVW